MTHEEQIRQQQEQQRRMQEAMMRAQMEQQRAMQEAQAQQQAAQRRATESQKAIDDDTQWKYAVIAAVDLDRGFSKDGAIPWDYPDDLNWFKQCTDGHVCVMGKATYIDINMRLGVKAKDSVLPNRKCFVVSSTLKQEDVLNATVIPYCYDAINFLGTDDVAKTIFFIGGERIFIEGIALATTVYLTTINNTFGCDKFFPVDFVDKHFIVGEMHKTETSPDLRFATFTRK
jgi:dihydrofolate reductase